MSYTALFTGILALTFSTQAHAGVVHDKSVSVAYLESQGYTIKPLAFTGPLVPGGDNVTLTGSADHILTQLMELNPTYNAAVIYGWDESSTETAGNVNGNEIDVDFNIDRIIKRERIVNDIRCTDRFRGVGRTSAVKEGIAKLKKLGGTCSAEPDTCTRMFCGDETGIYLCNNSDKTVSRSCLEIAEDYADVVRLVCTVDPYRTYFNGQIFDTEKFNVFLGGAECHW